MDENLHYLNVLIELTLYKKIKIFYGVLRIYAGQLAIYVVSFVPRDPTEYTM